MIPTKRPSPFARTRSFQAHKSQDSASRADPPFAKKPAFGRTMSTPFQVLSPSLRRSRNPFEKLVQQDNDEFAAPLHQTNAEGDPEDEAMDPNNTLQMFSFSQPNPIRERDLDQEKYDSDNGESIASEAEDEAPDKPTFDRSTLGTRRPRLHEALEMSLSLKKAKPEEDIAVPSTAIDTPRKKDTGVKTATEAPLDWTLKTSASITSQETLAWCDKGTLQDEIDALQHFTSSLDASSLSDPRTRLMAHSYHWTYPTNLPSTSQAQIINRLFRNATHLSTSEKANVTDLFSRTSEWKQSFRALYQNCRNGVCPYFYYLGSVWTILFQHGSVSTSGELEATLTHSTPGLRKVLDDDEIKYVRLPDISGKTSIQNFSSKHDLEGFDDDPSTGEAKVKVPFQMPEHQELSDSLLFKGQVDVHGLFSYLLTLKTSYEDGSLYYSPTLIASTPFLHAALKKAQISKCRVVSRPVEGTDTILKEFRIEIQGILLPLAVKALWDLFAQQQARAGFSFSATSEPRSFGLNLRPLFLTGETSCVAATGSSSLSSSQPSSSSTPSISTSTPSPSRTCFTGSKALDQVRYDGVNQKYVWTT